MYSILTLGRGHRIWWSLGIGRIEVAVGMPAALRDWGWQHGDRINDRGQLEVSGSRVVACVCLVRWTITNPETT